MIYFYKITDLKTGKTYNQRSEIDEFSSYRDFIGHLEAMNEFWLGLLKYEEDLESARKEEKITKPTLTSEFEMV